MPPFSVLHVCMGNICRSPMAERLLALHVAEHAADEAAVYSHSCGVGSWHVGQDMDAPAARELRARGADTAGFRARHIAREHVESSDLILTATQDQHDYVAQTYPDALPRTFLLRHFGLLVADVDAAELPDFDGSPEAVHARGTALAAAADVRRTQHPAKSLDDPWGESREVFTRIADEIEAALRPMVRALWND